MILNKKELSHITKALRHERDRQISMKLDQFNTKELLDKCRDEKDKKFCFSIFSKFIFL